MVWVYYWYIYNHFLIVRNYLLIGIFLSTLSPIKWHQESCTDWNTKLIDDFVKTSKNPKEIILSYKCKPNEEPIQFTFKAEVQNYKLYRSGKLLIKNKNSDQDSR